MKHGFTGFVLAGGKSSRMGADKFALKIDGETFLERAANVLKPACETVKIVLNQTQEIDFDFPIVRDVYPGRGALGGIHAALVNCETTFAVVLAVDLPFVTVNAIKNLINIVLASNEFSAFVPRQTDGRLQPLCAVYRAKDCLPALEKILGENNSASVRDFLALISPKIIEESRLKANENLLFNVNTPADFQRLR